MVSHSDMRSDWVKAFQMIQCPVNSERAEGEHSLSKAKKSSTIGRVWKEYCMNLSPAWAYSQESVLDDIILSFYSTSSRLFYLNLLHLIHSPIICAYVLNVNLIYFYIKTKLNDFACREVGYQMGEWPLCAIDFAPSPRVLRSPILCRLHQWPSEETV